MSRPLMFRNEVAARLHCDPDLVDELRRKGELPYIQLPGMKRLRYDPVDVDRLIERLKCASPSIETQSRRTGGAATPSNIIGIDEALAYMEQKRSDQKRNGRLNSSTRET